MTQTHKRIKTLTQFIEDAGLRLDCFVDKKDGRVWATAVAHNGQQRSFSLSNSTTQDPRGDLNERARIRRWAVEMGQPTQLAEKIREKLPEIKRVITLEPKTVDEAAIMDALDKLPKPEPDPPPPPPAPAAPPPTRRPMTLFRHKRPPMEDTPPAKPAKLETKTKKLTLHEQYMVIEWLKTFDTTQFEQSSVLATHINEVQRLIPVPVNAKFVADAMKMLGKKFKDRRVDSGGSYRRDRCRLVAMELRRMAESLGFALSPEFIDYVNQERGDAATE
jgi:hypothetical protein